MSGGARRKSANQNDVPTAPNKKRAENSWILLMKDSLLDNKDIDIVTLPHPGRGEPAKFCLDENHNKMYEVVTFSEPYRSWFIGQTVKSDGSMLMVTPVNPLFLVLPRLRQLCTDRAVPLDNLLSEKGFDKIIDYVINMDRIADLKGPPEMKAYKYNEEKTMSWLEDRVRKLAQVLRKKNIHVTSGSISTTFVASTINNENIDEELYLKYAHGIISDYLEEDIAELLEKRFDFKPENIETIGNKRKADAVSNGEPHKKTKLNPVDDFASSVMTNSSTLVKKQKPLTAKEKSRQKAASGTKTLSAFFTKK